MSFKFKVIGGLLAVTGLAIFGFGWPYRMVDWGGIQVMLGALMAVGGGLLAALGLALGEIRTLVVSRATVVEPPAAAASEAKEPVVAAPPMDTVFPKADDKPGLGAVTVATGAAAAAGAAIIGMGGKAAANEAREEVPREDETRDALSPPEPVTWPQAADLIEPSSLPEPLLPSVPKLDLDAFADDAFRRIRPERSEAGLSMDALTARINEAAGDLDLLRKGVSGDRDDPPAAVPLVDHAPVEPDEVPPIAARADDLSLAEDIAEALAEPEILPSDANDKAEEDADEDEPGDTEAAADGEPEAAPAGAEAEPEASDEPEEPASPVPNAEGIVGVHKVGASTFTMYADGTIRAVTPEGEFGFDTVADLKTYLAGDRSVARPL